MRRAVLVLVLVLMLVLVLVLVLVLAADRRPKIERKGFLHTIRLEGMQRTTGWLY